MPDSEKSFEYTILSLPNSSFTLQPTTEVRGQY